VKKWLRPSAQAAPVGDGAPVGRDGDLDARVERQVLGPPRGPRARLRWSVRRRARSVRESRHAGERGGACRHCGPASSGTPPSRSGAHRLRGFPTLCRRRYISVASIEKPRISLRRAVAPREAGIVPWTNSSRLVMTTWGRGTSSRGRFAEARRGPSRAQGRRNGTRSDTAARPTTAPPGLTTRDDTARPARGEGGLAPGRLAERPDRPCVLGAGPGDVLARR